MPKQKFVMVDNFYCWSVYLQITQFTMLSQPCVPHSEPAWCISQLRHGTAPKTPNPEQKRGPKGLSNYRLSFDEAAWLHNPLVLPLLLVLLVFVVISHLYGTLLVILLFLHNVFVFVAKERVSKREKGGDYGACAREQCGFSREWVTDRKREKEWEKCPAFAKENSFPCLDANGVQKPCDYHLKRQLSWSLSFSPSHSLSCSPRLSVLLSDWTLSFFLLPFTWPNQVCWVQFYSIRLA